LELDETLEKLKQARSAQEPTVLAEVLIEHANALFSVGQFIDARDNLDEAREIYQTLDSRYDQGRCAHLAASISRQAGDLDGARNRAMLALDLAERNSPIYVSALTELAELAMAKARPDDALKYYADAIEHGSNAGLLPEFLSALRRRRAGAFAAAREFDKAAKELQNAFQLIDDKSSETATRILVEKSTALCDGRYFSQAEKEIQGALAQAELTSDALAMADLSLLSAAIALEHSNPGQAIDDAKKARLYSLDAVAPVPYLSATITISELSERTGDVIEAYGALATGWVTLSDLMGEAVARESFRPKLEALRLRLGNVEFEAAKKAYEKRCENEIATIDSK
jgi:tetratricopeptide (TPR) repeat protein